MGFIMHLNSKWYRKHTASWRNCMEHFFPRMKGNIQNKCDIFCHINLSEKGIPLKTVIL